MVTSSLKKYSVVYDASYAFLKNQGSSGEMGGGLVAVVVIVSLVATGVVGFAVWYFAIRSPSSYAPIR